MIFIKYFFLSFLKKGHERTIRAKKNVVASFLIKGVSIIINLALVPLTINYVNPSQYGIWLTLSSIIAWFGIFDIGFGHGLRNRFAEAKAKGNFKQARIYVSTTYAVLILIFSAVWILFYFINYFVDWSKVLNAPSELAEELSALAIIVFSFFCIQIVLTILNTIIIADQKPAKAAFFDMLGQLIGLISIYVLTKTTEGSLIYLAFCLGVAPIIVLILSSFFFYSKQYKFYAPSLNFVQFKFSKNILDLGGKFFIIQISTIFVFQSTNLIITHLLGNDQVAIFNIAYKYFFIALTITNIIVAPFWSAFTEAYSKGDFMWMKNAVIFLNYIWYLIVFIIIIMLLTSRFVYNVWIGDLVTIPFLVSFLLAINAIVSSRFSIFIFLINGIGKIKLQLYANIVLSILYIPFTIFLGLKLGLNGVIISNIVISCIFAVIAPIQVNKIISGKAEGIWNE